MFRPQLETRSTIEVHPNFSEASYVRKTPYLTRELILARIEWHTRE